MDIFFFCHFKFCQVLFHEIKRCQLIVIGFVYFVHLMYKETILRTKCVNPMTVSDHILVSLKKGVIWTKPNHLFWVSILHDFYGTYCLKVKGLIYKQLMFMPLTFKQVYHHLTSKVTLSTGAVKNGVKFFLKERSYFYSKIWLPLGVN